MESYFVLVFMMDYWTLLLPVPFYVVIEPMAVGPTLAVVVARRDAPHTLSRHSHDCRSTSGI